MGVPREPHKLTLRATALVRIDPPRSTKDALERRTTQTRLIPLEERAPSASAHLVAHGGGFGPCAKNRSQPLAGGFSGRIVGVYEDSESYRNFVEVERWGLNPSIGWRNDQLTVVASYEHFEDDRVVSRPSVPLNITPQTAEGSWEARPGPVGPAAPDACGTFRPRPASEDRVR